MYSTDRVTGGRCLWSLLPLNGRGGLNQLSVNRFCWEVNRVEGDWTRVVLSLCCYSFLPLLYLQYFCQAQVQVLIPFSISLHSHVILVSAQVLLVLSLRLWTFGLWNRPVQSFSFAGMNYLSIVCQGLPLSTGS